MSRVALRWFYCSLVLVALLSSMTGCGIRRGPATPVDPRDAPFGALMLDAARAMIAAARGQPHDARWDGTNAAIDLRATPPTQIATMQSIGANAQLVAVFAELEATTNPNPGPSLGLPALNTDVMILPDGRVRWVALTARNDDMGSMTFTIAQARTAVPALAAAFERTIETLRGACNLPMVTTNDVAVLPPVARQEVMRSNNSQPATCAAVRALPRATWSPRVDDVSAILRSASGEWFQVRSELRFDSARVFLGPVQVRTLRR